MTEIPELDSQGLRRFGLTFSAIVAGLFGVVFPLVLSVGFPLWPWIIGGVVSAWALAAPATMGPFYRLWMRFGLVMNAIMSRIILGFVFYLIVLPTGWIIRLRGRDPMTRRMDSEKSTYRVASSNRPPSQMEKPF
ncbi:MAG: SxtJ family membrane protein [Gammaproteobacteria bacterium]|nr:SxtJ family membrane protein [Gammaproteobacteria bacterium]